MNRRDMLKVAGSAFAGASIFGPSAFANNKESAESNKVSKVLIIGAHPDDPETTCGGTILKLKEAEIQVRTVFLRTDDRCSGTAVPSNRLCGHYICSRAEEEGMLLPRKPGHGRHL